MSERLEREIEEILRKMDSTPPRRSFSTRFGRMVSRWGADLRYVFSGLRVTPTRVMVLSLVLFGVTIFLRGAMRQLALYVGLLAIVLFFTSIVMSARGSGGRAPEHRWRGQVVDLSGDSSWTSLRFWWARQRRKFRRWFDQRH